MSNKSDNLFAIDRIIIATTKTMEMCCFFEKLFSIKLFPVEAHGTTLYSGEIGGLKLLLCPNEIAKTVAENNRFQIEFIVHKLIELLDIVSQNVGQVKDKPIKEENFLVASFYDPDGNTFVFKEKVYTKYSLQKLQQ